MLWRLAGRFVDFGGCIIWVSVDCGRFGFLGCDGCFSGFGLIIAFVWVVLVVCCYSVSSWRVEFWWAWICWLALVLGCYVMVL